MQEVTTGLLAVSKLKWKIEVKNLCGKLRWQIEVAN
jgi:hypothetical protein